LIFIQLHAGKLALDLCVLLMLALQDLGMALAL
jgi:hypothetical protein